ncbi:MAG TPA: 4Fe-4S dicluster domain-containing protein [Fluviicoccus sp.]|nr:4Fe-4S dicluster domain-containing protein [Fluviicoccus sp.]
MKTVLIDSLADFRAFIAAHRVLIEPVREADGVVRWAESSPQRDWENFDGVPLSSLKPFFFAERETVFVFDGTHFRSRLPDVPSRVFFGVKACDAAALAVQDRFFAEDPLYQARRKSALVVAVDCVSPCAGGFCPLTDAGPLVREEGADLVLTPVARGWQLAARTANGERVLTDFRRSQASVVELDPVEAAQTRQALGDACVAAFGDLSALAAGLARVQAGAVTPAEWETLAIQCLSCSGCVNLCPSCSCFTTFDVGQPQGIVRERVWDACLYDGFQREASGHHPSPTPGARTARYWFHKFSPHFIPQQGRLGCTGCGRCDAVCPGVIGAKAVLTRVGAC